MAVGAVVARILTQYSDKGSKAAQKDIKKLGANIDKFAKKSAKAFGVAALASAAFAIKIGKDAVQGAMEDQKQQVALATALRNTTGATDEAIAATVQYLDKLELLVGVDNNELIPSLQILTQATKDVSVAQQLQSLALDISAGSGKDLTAVSLALAKAIGGNVGALTRLGVPLDANAVKSKDLNAILKSLGETFAGQAEKRAGTFEYRMKTLGLAFNQILDQLGYALIPVLESFAATLQSRILPAIQNWITLNKDQLAASFQIATEYAIKLIEAAFDFGNWVTNNMGIVKTIAGIIAGMFVINSVAVFIASLATISASLVALRTLAMTTGIAMSFATGGTSAIAGAIGAAAVVAAVGVSYAANKYGSSLRQAEGTTRNVRKGIIPRGNANNRDFSVIPVTGALDKFTFNLNAAAAATKKNMNDEINAAAAKKNLARQATLSGSSTIAIGASGSRSFGNRGMNVNVQVAGSVTTENDLITAISDGLERTARRSLGGTRFATAIR
jgi:hypothetical protein